MPERQRASNDDVFSDVRLRDTKLEIVPEAEETEPAPAIAKRNNRGYGEHKHDEYASDVDAADALAEADIYIAYGRHPQAIAGFALPASMSRIGRPARMPVSYMSTCG